MARSNPMRLLIVVLLALLGTLPAHADKVAMVLGNSGYLHANPLPNAANDARDIAARLGEIGFDVHLGLDLTRAQTLALVEDFSKALKPEDVALFYYAGHGVQIGTENYVIPVDADPGDEQGLVDQSVKLQTILRTMELRADRRIVILDACRNNPFAEKLASRGVGETSRGLAKVEAGVGSFIVFSTQPGNVALDGNGRNSPFTTALLAHIGVAGEDIHQMMLRVRADVVAATGQAQVPWENSSLIDEVYLAGAATAPAAEPPAEPAAEPTGEPAAEPQRQALAKLAPAQPETPWYYVSGLDPNGDGFLALRSGTSGDATRLAKMPEGTRLQLLDTQGVWYHVRLEDGREGWAHSRWIACCTGGTARSETVATPAPQSCESLWHDRNAIWAAYGYCFTSARGKAAFGTAGCSRNQAQAQAAMSPADRAEVDRLKAQEAAQGCP